MKASERMTRTPRTASLGQSIQEVARNMCQRLVRILSLRDIAMGEGLHPAGGARIGPGAR